MPKLSLGRTVYLLVFVVVLLSLVSTNLFIKDSIIDYIYESKGDKVSALAHSVASTKEIKEGLMELEKRGEVQPYVEELRVKTGVKFITVMDRYGVRVSHPLPEMIGQHFQGGDEQNVLKEGVASLTIAHGSLGESMRAIAPVWGEQEEIIGAVAVGITIADVADTVYNMTKTVIGGCLIGLVIGLMCATGIVRFIKHILFDLEPYEIAKLFHERKALLDSVQDGIISVTREKEITLINEVARRKLVRMGAGAQWSSEEILALFHEECIDQVIQNNKPIDYQEITVNGYQMVVNYVPIFEKNQVQGVLISFQDRTELRKMAEQLSGVKVYAQSLRAQTHEFKNRMHVISGMLHLKHYDKLENYIHNITQQNEKDTKFIINYTADPVLSGFLLGKLSRARECGVDLTIQIPNVVPLPANGEVTGALVTIIGNLLENSMEAVAEKRFSNVHLELFYENEMLDIVVEDTGDGIPMDLQEDIFQKGYSTKGNERGYGLFLVKQSLEELRGTMEWKSSEEQGTQFILSIPYELGEHND